MKKFSMLSTYEQRLIITNTARKMKLADAIVEKDYENMKPMIFGNKHKFEDILSAISSYNELLNKAILESIHNPPNE